jgi:hypothetical protein
MIVRSCETWQQIKVNCERNDFSNGDILARITQTKLCLEMFNIIVDIYLRRRYPNSSTCVVFATL